MPWQEVKPSDTYAVSCFLKKADVEDWYPVHRLPGGVEGVMDLCTHHGGSLYHDRPVTGFCGYVLGEPPECRDHDILSVYLCVLDPAIRRIPSVASGLLSKLGNIMVERRTLVMRFSAIAANTWLNRMYSKMASPVYEGINLAGFSAVYYETNCEKLARFHR